MSEHLLVFHEGKRERIKFSLISPTFRRPDEVAEFLDSLQNQSYTDFEVILADGTPTRLWPTLLASTGAT